MRKGRKKDYQLKDYQNPFFPKKQVSKKSRLTKFYFLALIILIIGGLYFLNSSDLFQIQKVEVTGQQQISQIEVSNIVFEQLKTKRWLLFDQGSIWFFNQRQTRKQLEQNYLFDSLKIKKKYFDTIKVEIVEKQSGIAWVSGTSQHFLGLTGVALRQVDVGGGVVVEQGSSGTEVIRSEISSGNFPLVYDQSASPVTIGQLITSDDLVNFVINLSDGLDGRADFEFSHYTIERPFAREINLVTNEGWQAYFKIDDDPIQQLNLLLLVLQQKVKDRASLEYIDLRFGEKVFYQ